MKILVVDDDPGCREVLHSLLNNNHELSMLTNGRNALAVLADDEHEFDLVLLDLNMPRMSGQQLIDVMSECALTDVRFVVMTGLPNFKPIPLPNVVGILRKPFQIADINRLLAEVTANSDPLQSSA